MSLLLALTQQTQPHARPPGRRRLSWREWESEEAPRAPEYVKPDAGPNALHLERLRASSEMLAARLRQLEAARVETEEAATVERARANAAQTVAAAMSAADGRIGALSDMLADLAEIEAQIQEVKRRIREIDIVFITVVLQ